MSDLDRPIPATGTYSTYEEVQKSWNSRTTTSLTILPDINPQNTTTDPTAQSYVAGVVVGNESTGPLKDLYNNKYNTTSIAYPKDIDSFDKGHAIQFNIRDIKPFTTSFAEVQKKVNQIKNVGEKAYSETNGQVQDKAMAATAAVSKELLNLKYESVGPVISTVRLYMPDTLAFSYQAQYDKLSLADAINSTPLVGKISTAITSMVNSNLGKTIGSKLGYTFNPQQQMLFEGIDFREFDLQFSFAPTSPDEAASVRQIIKQFQRAAAPTKMTGSAGFFWTPPSVFDIDFFFNGVTNPNVPPVLRCALQSVNVDYAPNGWSALSDGAPVQTTLSLSFREIELLDRDMMKELESRV